MVEEWFLLTLLLRKGGKESGRIQLSPDEMVEEWKSSFF
jgi:hypothetical protein